VAVNNFASKVRSGEVKLVDFLPVKEISGQQKAAISSFFGFQRVAKPIIEAGLKRREGTRAQYNFRDPIQFLINEDGTLDENLITALSFSAYSYAVDSASNLINSDSSINSILGKKPDEEISSFAYEKLAHVGSRQALVISQLGAKAMQSIGMKALDNASINERARMETSMGNQVLRLLLESGLAERHTISDADMQYL